MKKSNMRRIALIYGGKSVEHEISIITACLAKGYFDGELYSVYLDRNNRAFLAGNDWTPRQHLRQKLTKQVVFLTGERALGIVNGKRLTKIPIDVAVNCCHGLFGEDGCVAALCRMSDIPLVGSDVAASAVAMDKVLTKQLLTACGFPVVKGVCAVKGDLPDVTLTYPLIVKPALLGSSIGVEVCHSQSELSPALERAFRYCGKVLVEEALTDFTEINCAAMRTQGKVKTSAVETPVTLNELLTFSDKYINGAYQKPAANLAQDVQTEASRLTAEIYEKLFFGGVIRVDYLLDNQTGKLYVNEINTTPGSLAFGLWEANYSRASYGQALTEQAIADNNEMQSFTYTFDSGVLNGAGGIKKK